MGWGGVDGCAGEGLPICVGRTHLFPTPPLQFHLPYHHYLPSWWWWWLLHHTAPSQALPPHRPLPCLPGGETPSHCCELVNRRERRQGHPTMAHHLPPAVATTAHLFACLCLVPFPAFPVCLPVPTCLASHLTTFPTLAFYYPCLPHFPCALVVWLPCSAFIPPPPLPTLLPAPYPLHFTHAVLPALF